MTQGQTFDMFMRFMATPHDLTADQLPLDTPLGEDGLKLNNDDRGSLVAEIQHRFGTGPIPAKTSNGWNSVHDVWNTVCALACPSAP